MTTPDTSIASRELDLFIAEHICGWEWWRSSSSGRRCLFAPGVIPRQNLGSPEWFLERAAGDEELVSDWDYSEKDIPHYSSDRSAAFELLWSFDDFSLNVTDGIFSLYIRVKDNPNRIGKTDYHVMDDVKDAALLICQCALDTVEDKLL